jgi:putative DNA-invertase from lambdoid prophage Rac
MERHELLTYSGRMAWVAVEYEEKGSGKRRPVFSAMIEDARLGRVNVILVWRIDHFARSMKDYVLTMLDLYKWKVRLICAAENVDTAADHPLAESQRSLLALLAKLERRIVASRVTAGIARSRRDSKSGRIGKKKHTRSGKDLPLGRPKRIFRRDEAIQLRMQGVSLRKIAAYLGVPFTTVADALKSVRKTLPKTPF